MAVILSPTGRGLAIRAQIPMTARQVTWFIDPEALLRHLGDLAVLKVAAYCQRCYSLGLDDTVTAQYGERQWTPRCACSDYPVILQQGDGPLVMHQVDVDGTMKTHRLRSVDELLQKLGWSFRCASECARLGMADGVQGNNDAHGSMLTVSCGCTERLYLDKGRFN